MMASFVSEILSSAGQMETQEANTKLKELTKKVDILKMQLRGITTHKYADFLPKLHSTEQLVSDVEHMKTEMDEVSIKIEHQIKGQLNVSTGEFQALTSQLEDVNSIVTLLEKLVNLQEGLKEMEISAGQKQYSKAVDAMHMVKSRLSNKVHGHEEELQILDAIKTELTLQSQKLIQDLLDKWKDMIQWEVPDDQKKSRKGPCKYQLHLRMKEENAAICHEVVVGMEKTGILTEEMNKFFNRVLGYIVDPIMSGQCAISENVTGQESVLIVSTQGSTVNFHPTPTEFYACMDQVQRFLSHNLLHISVKCKCDENSPPATLLSYFRDMVADKILSLAVKECLIPSIPTNNKDLKEFSDVIIITEEFHNQWVKAGLITDNNTVLLDFIDNVNALFANKKCQELLVEARRLMTTEIHNTVQVSQDKPLGELPPLINVEQKGKKARKLDLMNVESPLSGSTFRLPPCKISSSIQEVMVMAYETLHEAASSSKQSAIQMYCAIRHMFELFCSVFPTYHKQSLETLPQFTALHYNNCMYIAHHLMTLGHQYSKKLPESINVTFVDLVPKIRQLGTEYFLRQLATQREQILEYLNAANGFINVSQKDAFLASEKAMKQALHQLQHLKKVWQDVLPPSTYRKALGGLVNSLAVEMVDSVIALEDISADDTKQLSRLLNTVIERGPELFEIPGDTKANVTAEMQRNVAKWQRLKELDMILTSSLLDIVDRWAAGKGPLAVAFTANEVKQLIRALFQNTDRRAAVLAKINS